MQPPISSTCSPLNSEIESNTKQGASKGPGASFRTDISDDDGSDEEDNQSQDSRTRDTMHHAADKPAPTTANKAPPAKTAPAPEEAMSSIQLMLPGDDAGMASVVPAHDKTELASKSLSLKPALAPVPIAAAAR